MEFQPLKHIYIPSDNPKATTLLLLHGTGGNENDLIPIAKNFGAQFNILSVRGNVSEHGMPRFFKRLAVGVFDEEDLKFRTHELVHFIKTISTQEKFDISNLLALGYSNGANIAGSTLMLYPNFLSGAILFRPMIPFSRVPVFKTSKKTPVFISSGNYDTMVTTSEIELYKDLLVSNHFDVTLHHLKTGHNLTDTDINLAMQWTSENYARFQGVIY